MRRKISYDILKRVLLQKHHAHLLLKELTLPALDQAFVSALVYSVLQNKLFLEYQVNYHIKKKPSNRVFVLLLMGACEALILDKVPDYAVVNEYVDLAKSLGFKHQSGFVNKILKQIVMNKAQPITLEGLEKISIEKSVPLWILNLLKAQYGEEFAIDYATYIQKEKPIYGWVNRLKYDPKAEDYLNDGIMDPKVFQSNFIKDSKIIIQDINSQRVVDLISLNDGMRVLDCCCAPGTKTLKLANLLNNTGEIVGVDIAKVRVDMTRELMENANVTNATIIEGDATQISFDEPFDVVMVDAPCSGLGVLSHKHDLRYNIQPKDLDDLEQIQKAILNNVAQYVKKGGSLYYMTCTLNKKENERQVNEFLKSHSDYECHYEETLNPIESMGDGFYVAHLVRKC